MIKSKIIDRIVEFRSAVRKICLDGSENYAEQINYLCDSFDTVLPNENEDSALVDRVNLRSLPSGIPSLTMPPVDKPEEPTLAQVLTNMQAICTQLAALQGTVADQYGSMQAAMGKLSFRLAHLEAERNAREKSDDIDEFWQPPSEWH